jgi:hypothetical protein
MTIRIIGPALLALAGGAAQAETIRIAQFNAAMNRDGAGELTADLASGTDPQIRAVAEIIQRVDPDILLVNEMDYAPGNAALFVENYLNVPQDAATAPVDYPHVFEAPSNTGEQSGIDLDGDGAPGGPGDAYGFGFFEGQFAMAILSKRPILEGEIRTFREFLWADMSGARLPVAEDGTAFYTEEQLAELRLSSKSHWDVPIEVNGEVIHLLASHPTPPVFDGPEDRNGLRNADEIRLIADYVEGADYIVDDEGVTGGLASGESFVIAGDLNADPEDGSSVPGAAQQVTENPLVQDPGPASRGGPDAAARQGGANEAHTGDPALDTADFNDAEGAAGNLRADYVLPSADLRVTGSGVFWPEATDPLFPLVGDFPFPSSDHRLVYVDVVAPIPVPAGLPLLAGALGLLWLRRRS